MNKYTLSDVLNLTIKGESQKQLRLKELREYILLKALEFYLTKYDLTDGQITEIERLLSQNNSDNYPNIFNNKYQEVSTYYYSLEIKMMGSLLLEDLRQINNQNPVNEILELIKSIQGFIYQDEFVMYNEKEKVIFNNTFEKYKMIKESNGTRG